MAFTCGCFFPFTITFLGDFFSLITFSLGLIPVLTVLLIVLLTGFVIVFLHLSSISTGASLASSEKSTKFENLSVGF